MGSVLLTKKGFKLLSEELRELLEVRRPQVMVDLAQAREFGDISENAEYETAKRDQGMIEGRVHELESLLASSEIIALPDSLEQATLGVVIEILNLATNKDRTYQLVSEQEAHLSEDYLSVTSPLGKALLGAKKGETVTFQAPAGTRSFKVLEISSPKE